MPQRQQLMTTVWPDNRRISYAAERCRLEPGNEKPIRPDFLNILQLKLPLLDIVSSSGPTAMKPLSVLVAVAALAAKVSAHYTWPQLIIGGVNTTSAWEFVRQTNNWQDLNPVTDVTSTDIRCYTSLESGTSSTATVAAGSTVGFTVSGNPDTGLYHPGSVNVYMAKAPAGTDVASWDGSGDVWFKVFQIPAVADGVTIQFPSENLVAVNFTIPSALPSGQYLIRIEHIALHVAETFGGAQFYISCAQVQVTNGGTGTPGPLVAFPGAYTGNEPGILINIYFPIPTSYIQPGPAVWSAGGSGAPAPPVSSSTSSTIVKTTPPVTSTASTTKATSTTATVTTTSSTATSTGTVPEWGQCGGTGYVGATTCQSPFTCSVLNPFYSQCI
ncbi:glycosyl hydrolase family 61-domain-containing protein [Mycena metata]|uniref:lytic cellulose monooxygenase (C4-dehydrogenating) n=1 Tax=Mycena metata TaxID=1033252 RepID=A0AAD7JXP7_9AGAR|nr:glycosyl hydrolase family 61-domain-containing protein [Mycena metata]